MARPRRRFCPPLLEMSPHPSGKPAPKYQEKSRGSCTGVWRSNHVSGFRPPRHRERARRAEAGLGLGRARGSCAHSQAFADGEVARRCHGDVGGGARGHAVLLHSAFCRRRPSLTNPVRSLPRRGSRFFPPGLQTERSWHFNRTRAAILTSGWRISEGRLPVNRTEGRAAMDTMPSWSPDGSDCLRLRTGRRVGHARGWR